MPLYPVTDTKTDTTTLVEAKNGPRALERYLEGRFTVGAIIKDPVDVATATMAGQTIMLEGGGVVPTLPGMRTIMLRDFTLPLGGIRDDTRKILGNEPAQTQQEPCPVAAFTAGMEDCDKPAELPPLGQDVVTGNDA